MKTGALDIRTFVVGMALAAVLLFSAQALAVTAAPQDAGVGATSSVGRTGFAYLGGLRRFVAAVLWNRLDPQFHEYYEGIPLAKQTYMMPTLNMVTVLDPQFEQAYYLASWLARISVSEEEGLAIARRGLEANPRSGLLTSNLAQLLYIEDAQANQAQIEPLIDEIMSDTLTWMDEEALYEGVIVARDALAKYGRLEDSARLDQVLERMREAGAGAGDHDHDGDGVQDH